MFLAGVDAACRERFVGLESNRRRRGSGILSILHAFLHGFYFYLLSFIPRVHTKQSTKSPNLLLESQKDDFGCHRERQLYELLCCVRILHGCLICDPENYTRLITLRFRQQERPSVVSRSFVRSFVRFAWLVWFRNVHICRLCSGIATMCISEPNHTNTRELIDMIS